MNRKDIINELAARGYKAEAYDAIKNGVVFHGIVIRDENDIAPIIYTDHMLEEAQETGKNISDVADDVIRIFEKNKLADIPVGDLLNKEFILDHIYIGVQRTSMEKLAKEPCDLDGMETYLYVRGEHDQTGTYSIKMTNGYLDSANLSFREAWKRAEKNTFSETLIQSLQHVLSKMMDTESDISFDQDIPLYVISNKENYLGASAILNKPALKKFGKTLGIHKLIVIPSSIHEMLLVPCEENEDLDSYSNMVQAVNHTAVAPEERLTDRAYIVTL